MLKKPNKVKVDPITLMQGDQRVTIDPHEEVGDIIRHAMNEGVKACEKALQMSLAFSMMTGGDDDSDAS